MGHVLILLQRAVSGGERTHGSVLVVGYRSPQSRSTSSLGSTPRASAILRTVLSRGFGLSPVSKCKIVVGLTSARLARSRCETKRSSRSRLSFAPTNFIVGIIVVTSGDSFGVPQAEIRRILRFCINCVHFIVA